MEKSKVIGVRFRGKLLTQIQHHDKPNSELIRTVMKRYFLDDRKNQKLFTNVNKNVNNVYSQDLIDSLTSQIDFLQSEVQDWKNLSIVKMSWWEILKMKWIKTNTPMLTESKHQA